MGEAADVVEHDELCIRADVEKRLGLRNRGLAGSGTPEQLRGFGERYKSVCYVAVQITPQKLGEHAVAAGLVGGVMKVRDQGIVHWLWRRVDAHL